MYKENVFLRIITYGPIIFIPFVVAVISFILLKTYNDSFDSNIKKVEKDLYTLEKNMLKNKVTDTVDFITYRKSIVKNELKTRVRDRVEEAFLQAENIYNTNKETHSEQEIKAMIKDALQPLIWNNGESFIWIVDFDGVFEMAPSYLKHLEGSSIINFQDVDKRYVIQEEISICRKSGSGFLWDTFTKPNSASEKQYEQVAYVKAFGHYNWYFGSGEYLDTASKKSDAELLNTIAKIDEINEYYMFLLTDKGTIYMAKSQLDVVGYNISKMHNQEDINAAKKIIEALKDKNETLLQYKIVNPKTKQSEMKYSYIKRVPNSDWIVGTGFYESDIQNKLSQVKVDMYEVVYTKHMNLVYLGIFLLLFSLIISYYLSQKLANSFQNYEQNINRKSKELQELNATLEEKVENRTAALKQLKDKFEILATTDSLTKMNNRYSLMKLLSSEINRANRYKTPMSLIFYDLDNFKFVNDNYGHDVGDVVLASVSAIVKNHIRDIDILGRYGGEEFLIVLPNTTLQDAEIFAQRIRKAVEEHTFKDVDSITISLGLVELQSHETINEVINRADELLYKSKKNGRNQVSC